MTSKFKLKRRSAYQLVLFVALIMMLFLTTAFKNPNGASPDKKPGEKQGEFYADTLFWAGETKEVWLKGKVIVKFGNNHFKGNGSFSSFGKVNLLLVNGQKASPNASMVISGNRCEVATLTKEEATGKYGMEGEFGALEITVVH